MHICRQKLLTVSRLLLWVVLFGHFSLAAQACVMPVEQPAMAVASPDVKSCHQQSSNNACLVQCLENNQLLNWHLQQDFTAPFAWKAATVATVVTDNAGFSFHNTRVVCKLTQPPPYLRFHHFLT